MPAIKAIGFDLGETLVYYADTPLDWAAQYPDAMAAVANACRLNPSPEQFAVARAVLVKHNTRLNPRTVEVPAEELFALILRLWNADPAHGERAIEAFFTFFQQRLCAYADAAPALQSLRERGLAIGILTDVPYGMPRQFVERDLESAGMAGLFDVLLTSVEVGRRKPEPAGFISLATRLGASPQEMIYIGNEPKDVIGAKRAGMQAALLDRDGQGGEHGQDLTVATLTALVENVLAES